jgi:hypothetical protein
LFNIINELILFITFCQEGCKNKIRKKEKIYRGWWERERGVYGYDWRFVKPCAAD